MRACSSSFWFTSCWYCPTPIDLGSIFTNSLSGSCTRLPIDTALRSSTWNSGNSFLAISEAEYTEAPASFTIINWAFSWYFFITFATNCSVSRLAVPLPIAINSTLFSVIILTNSFSANSILDFGGWGYITLLAINVPKGLITANLHPVLNAGSTPKICLPFIGGCNNKCFKFSLNTSIAWCSAFSVKSFRISLSIEGKIKRFKLSLIADSIYSTSWWAFFTSCDCINVSIEVVSNSILIDNTFSFSPRFIAKIRWLTILFIGSE